MGKTCQNGGNEFQLLFLPLTKFTMGSLHISLPMVLIDVTGRTVRRFTHVEKKNLQN